MSCSRAASNPEISSPPGQLLLSSVRQRTRLCLEAQFLKGSSMSGRDRRSRLACWRALLALSSVVAVPVMASAQTTRPPKPPAAKSEISIQAGGAHPGIPLQGNALLPDQTPLFATVNGRLSRPVPTWFFANGASLLNQVITQAQTGVIPTPIDAVAMAPSSN